MWRRGPRTIAGLLLFGLSGGCGGERPAPAPVVPARVRPKVPRSLVVVDLSGVRYDEVAPVGDAVAATSMLPQFRALGNDGAFFTQAVTSAGWDAPAIAGLFSGLSPDQCTVQGRPADGQRTMIPAIETLAEMLEDGGYATGAFTAGGHIARHSGLQQGFRTWEEVPDDGARLAKARSWLKGLPKDAPHFLFFHAAATVGATQSGTVDAKGRARRVAELDSLLGTWRELASDSWGKDGGWFVALSDHGDVLDAREGGLDAGDTGTLDPQIRVPLAIVGPEFARGPFDASVSLLDFVPTIRDLLGLERAPLTEGWSWKPILGSPSERGRPALAQAWRRVRAASNPVTQHLVSVRLSEVKFTAAFDVGPGTWTESMFDLLADPKELTPLAAGDVLKFGADFAHAVALVRESLGRGKALRDDPIAGPYFVRSSGK